MADFTYSPPGNADFAHTLRRLLQTEGETQLVGLLAGAQIELSTCGLYSRQRWNGYAATVRVVVPVERIAEFDAKTKQKLVSAADRVIPPEVGFDVTDVEVAPFVESPPDEDAPLPGPTWKPDRLIKHEDLYFRSKTETRIYDVLKTRKVLFFTNATAVLGGKGEKREPDFLVCCEGRWGILEVMGEQYHPAATAMRDHDRARLFKDYGIQVIEFYDAKRCYSAPESVVDDFLSRLRTR
ncbi:MAG: hypothetical protein HY898_25175 [Deltaproteobacteria bacterium]|nr:hypothetical protein [Deltaproteobacteria bacterium]